MRHGIIHTKLSQNHKQGTGTFFCESSYAQNNMSKQRCTYKCLNDYEFHGCLKYWKQRWLYCKRTLNYFSLTPRHIYANSIVKYENYNETSSRHTGERLHCLRTSLHVFLRFRSEVTITVLTLPLAAWKSCN